MRHVLRSYDKPECRRRVNAGLDRIECLHRRARRIFFASRGENWEREFEEQLNRSSSLMTVANARVLWNVVHLSEVIKKLREDRFNFEPDDLKHVSLYAFEHITQYGQYFFNLQPETASPKRRSQQGTRAVAGPSVVLLE